MQGREEASRLAHNQENAGSSPAPATNFPVAGYGGPQPIEAIEAVNAFKLAEERLLRALDELATDDDLEVDKRWLSIGRTQVELGFMAINRSIFKPERVELPDEDEAIVESGWVLERADSPVSAPLYFAGGGEHGTAIWSEDHLKALRLARKQDAAGLAAAIGVEVRACEHQWG